MIRRSGARAPDVLWVVGVATVAVAWLLGIVQDPAGPGPDEKSSSPQPGGTGWPQLLEPPSYGSKGTQAVQRNRRVTLQTMLVPLNAKAPQAQQVVVFTLIDTGTGRTTQTCSAVTGGNGVATCELPQPLIKQPGQYRLKARVDPTNGMSDALIAEGNLTQLLP